MLELVLVSYCMLVSYYMLVYTGIYADCAVGWGGARGAAVGGAGETGHA